MNNIIKKNMIFWKDFWLVFILGGGILGFLEAFLYDYEFTYLGDLHDVRIRMLFQLFKCMIFFGFFLFSCILLLRDSRFVTYGAVVYFFVFVYFILAIYVFSFFHYYSPISYFAGHLYNGFSNGIWNEDIISTLLRRVGTERGV